MTRGPEPLIGMCTALERAQFGAWDADAFLLQRTYVEAVQGAGGVVLMLGQAPFAARNPASRSARMSSMCSMPTARRTRPGVTPESACSSGVSSAA